MVRRKGEMSSTQLDREYPHQIILPCSQYNGTAYRTVQAFCIGLSLAPRGHSVVVDDAWHHVFCFAERTDAESFKARFGGEWFDPSRRGRGSSWHRLREPKKGALRR